jgi:predicted transcriptional regulator
MSSLKIPKDIKVLSFCCTPKIQYEIMQEMNNGQSTVQTYIERLVKMGLLFVVEEKEYRPGKKSKKYLITDKGRAVLRAMEKE